MPDDEDPATARTIASASNTPTQVTGSLPALTAPELPPSVIANRYEIVGLLGAGGMGQVYKAHDRSLDETVALKIVRADLLGQAGTLERFRQEVKLARRVTSPNVVRTFDLGEHQGLHYLTMELLDARSLARVLDDGQISMDEHRRIARGIASGIAAAHAAGVLHRDLKPDNVLIERNGPRVAITDFGIARATADALQTGESFLGTPAYMAPEQVEGRKEIGPAVDVYAFGAMMFEMLTRRRAWPGNDPIAVAIARLQQPPPDPRDLLPVPAPAAELILRCLAREPAARFADGMELLRAIDEVMAAVHMTIVTPPLAAVPAKTSRAIALLPMTAAEDLAEVADGLSEEIVDALSMTRSLRVVSLASVRAVASKDPRAVGRALGVDVVVDGSVRRRGTQVRVSARAISVQDGFQLWADKVDADAGQLLEAGDKVAQAIGHALTVELALPARPMHTAGAGRAIELYLEGKARMRASWYETAMASALALLEEAYGLTPNDGNVVAALAMARTRHTFLKGEATPDEHRALAERAVTMAGDTSEPWLALGLVSLYQGSGRDAAAAMLAAVRRATGNSLAQSSLGAVLLEADRLDDALAHLEAASQLDPRNAPWADVARAYWYAGREQEAFAALEREGSPTVTMFRRTQVARFRMWRGETVTLGIDTTGSPPEFARFIAMITNFHSRNVSIEDVARAEEQTRVANKRIVATRGQYLVEQFAFAGRPELAMFHLERAVVAGLFDHAWMTRCPVLEVLRGDARFQELAAVVRGRAEAVVAALG